jgi:hypothetical protein
MLTAVVVAVVVAAAAAAVPFNQVAALNELFASTNGKEWSYNSNWGVGDPCANAWFGVSCSDGVMCVACGTAA